MNLFAATSGWEGLLVLVGFMVVSAIANWLKGKRQTSDETDTFPRESQPPSPGRQPVPRPRSRALDWEEELRRILGEESPSPAPPPPIIPSQAPAPVARRVVVEPAPRTLATLEESSTAYRRAEQLDEKMEERVRQRAAMSESTAAYQLAATLDTKTEVQLRQVTESPVRLTRVARRGAVSPEIVQTVALGRQPGTARQAILASVILGPPKALEISAG